MDSITQGMLGAAVAECGFRHRLGRGATLMGAIGGLLPDADFVLGTIDPWWSWQYHRHFTHSVFFAPLLAAPLGWLFWRRGRQTGFGLWYLCALLAIGTHPLLDACTSYGTTLFAPISGVRPALDWIAIVDPVYSFILLAGIVACVILRRVGRSGRTGAVGSAAMALSVVYLLYGALNHREAMSRVYACARKNGQTILNARAIPQVGSVYVWRLVYRTPDGIYVGRTNTRFNREPVFAHLRTEDHPLIRKADQHPLIRFFHGFAGGCARPMVVRTNPGWRVIYEDLRYSWVSNGTQSIWAAVVDFYPQGRIVSVQRASVGHRDPVGEVARTVWRDIQQP